MTANEMRALGGRLFAEDPHRTADEVYDRIEVMSSAPLPLARTSWQKNHAPRVRKAVGVNGYRATGRRRRRLDDVRAIRRRIEALDDERADLIGLLQAMTTRPAQGAL